MENKSSSEIGSQDSSQSGTITEIWKKPTLFNKKKRPKNDAFDVDMEFSSQESEGQLSQVSSISSQSSGKTLSQDTSHNFKKLQLFKDQKRQLKDAFDVDFEESKQISTPEDTNDGNLTKIKKSNPFQNNKQKRHNAFDVDFEESKQLSTPEDTNDENLSNIRKQNPFQSKKQTRYNAFEIDFEESKQISTPEDTNDGNLTKIRKPNPFQNKKQTRYNAFEIDFEESNQISTPEDTNDGNLSKIRKQNPFESKKQTRYNAFEIDFEESKQLSTPEDTNDGNLTEIRKSNPFQNKKSSTINAFDVDFEDSKHLSTPEDTNDGNLSKIRKQNPFQNKSLTRHNAFEIDFEESATGAVSKRSTPNSSVNTPFRASGKKLTQNSFSVNFDRSEDASDARSEPAEQRETSFGEKSGERIRRDGSMDGSHLRLDVSSFNDENLNNWMSDHSEDDEVQRNESLVMESPDKRNFRVSSPMKTTELNFTSDEDLEKRFQEKMNAIIDEACKGKIEKCTTPALPKTNNVEKSNKKRTDDKDGKKSNTRATKLVKPAPFVNKRLYNYLIKTMEPRYGIDSVLEAEDMVKSICEAVKIVLRRKNYQKKIVNDLKVDMAKHGIIETTNDFYVFVRSFLPYDFREKVIPCLQPGTNIVFPPKDSKSPFEKILNN